MKITEANRSIWENLFQAAIQFRDTAPWKWMYDTHLFGVEHPETGEIAWCSIMGNADEVFSLVAYLGDEGFRSFERFFELEETSEEADIMHTGIGVKALKVEFVDREEIEKEDREAFKALGLQFRGRQQWVQVRDCTPGYYPWFMSDEQAVFLTLCLQQGLAVAERVRKGEDFLLNDDDDILVRTPKKQGKELVWHDRYLPDPAWEESPDRKVDPFLLNRAKKELEHKEMAACFSLDYLPGAFHPDGEEDRPFFSRMGIWMDYASGMILGFEIFSPKSFESKFEQVFFEKLRMFEGIPSQWVVNSNVAYDVLQPYAEALEAELFLDPDLELFDHVRRSMDAFFEGRSPF